MTTLENYCEKIKKKFECFNFDNTNLFKFIYILAESNSICTYDEDSFEMFIFTKSKDAIFEMKIILFILCYSLRSINKNNSKYEEISYLYKCDFSQYKIYIYLIKFDINDLLKFNPKLKILIGYKNKRLLDCLY